LEVLRYVCNLLGLGLDVKGAFGGSGEWSKLLTT
jgi:hypothetical protein